MRWSSSYTRAASRSNAVWSPPLQALNKPVISADRGSIAIPKKKISRPWPVFPSTSARSGGGGTGNEDHTLGCHVGNGIADLMVERGIGVRKEPLYLMDIDR